jgi:hypothetical protein
MQDTKLISKLSKVQYPSKSKVNFNVIIGYYSTNKQYTRVARWYFACQNPNWEIFWKGLGIEKVGILNSHLVFL